MVDLHNKTARLIAITAFSVLILFSLTKLILGAIDSWTQDVVHEKMALTERVVRQLSFSSEQFIDSLDAAGVFNRNTLTEVLADKIDSSLKTISTRTMKDVEGIEGGFYFPGINKFLGYDYPTSPPPKPKYGPPPRSYDIIQDQLDHSINGFRPLTQLHQFVPAVFPLATVPIIRDGVAVGGVWARVHIEKDLPWAKISVYFNPVGIVFLFLFIAVAVSFVRIRRQLKMLRLDIEKIEDNPEHRVTEHPGVFGPIGGYINKMVTALSAEHEHRQILERELSQKEKMATLGSLISGVVHELKTPLAIIKTRVQIWQQEIKKLNTTNKLLSTESIQIVVDEIDRLTRLSRRLLNFSKSVSSELHPLNIHDVFLRAVSMTQFNHNVYIRYDFPENLSHIRGDAGALEQIFINVLTNSVEAMPQGGVVTAIAKPDEKEKAVVIEIRDEGCGIPDELRERVFEPFFTTKSQGVGLGLSICREIIASHKGRMEVFPNETRGTLIRIFLPVYQD